MIKVSKPTELVYIAIDGPCPKPKMVQQRLRRYKSAKEKKVWDTNAITPGTKFMENLEKTVLDNIDNGVSEKPNFNIYPQPMSDHLKERLS